MTSATICIMNGDFFATPPSAITPLIGTPSRREPVRNRLRAEGRRFDKRAKILGAPVPRPEPRHRPLQSLVRIGGPSFRFQSIAITPVSSTGKPPPELQFPISRSDTPPQGASCGLIHEHGFPCTFSTGHISTDFKQRICHRTRTVRLPSPSIPRYHGPITWPHSRHKRISHLVIGPRSTSQVESPDLLSMCRE